MSIDNLIKIKIREIFGDSIKFSEKTWYWCKLPYPNHRKGCPNYNKNPLCPPKAKYMIDILNKYFNFYLIYAEFNLKKQKERMLNLHQHWSDKQAGCLLYWQNSVKKILKHQINKICRKNRNKTLYLFSCGSGFKGTELNQKTIYSMEAGGIDVFKTLKNNYIDFELKPKNKVILATLLCSNEPLQIE